MRRCPHLLLILMALSSLVGCDTFMTKAPTAGNEFAAPVDGLDQSLNAVFLHGDGNFEKPFTVAEGLGPIFNNVSCEGCHPGDGRGTPETGFFRFSEAGDLLIENGGPQHQDKVIPGIRLVPEGVPAGVDRSFRLPPPVFGVGLIEAIPEETILALADPDDVDGDGISGRPNWVQAADFVPAAHVGGGPGVQLGRFSRKLQVSSLLEQVAAAYQQDMGITSDFIPGENFQSQHTATVSIGDIAPDPEIAANTVLETVMYVRLLQPPSRGRVTAEVEQGEALFADLKCSACHVPTMRTGQHELAALTDQEVVLYSDLLLHDMGEALADHRPDGDADGTEWRTAPLWGTRLVAEFLGGREFYLHDGRATTLEEAVTLHGGEAQASRDGFVALSAAERAAVISFLRSL
ncbi:MAG: thiol oxidoreductase [Gemmatimonadetes bacterium]|jgi:CxxC motif-containing protein (DUF1111 family)|nr:thiol oxidoreductase [Gemmatimonadota bacterium]MBT6145791.1 thiol oxidoreductase [Gemmatimonadota bacterium]MBT7861012.1 thiol oxidoreductase [Gemmatimonadota bacterium]